MNTLQTDIYQHIQGLMVELFELDADAIVPEAQLYDDLDIDSIDAVNLMIELRPYVGRKLTPKDFQSIRTVQHMIDEIEIVLRDSKTE